MKKENRNTGLRGETMAVELLKEKNYNILEKNYSNRFGEIDIIAEDCGTIVFVEVKTRKNYRFGRPHEAVDYEKIRHIKNTADRYIAQKQWYRLPIRYDIIEIILEEDEKNKINHIENAFIDSEF